MSSKSYHILTCLLCLLSCSILAVPGLASKPDEDPRLPVGMEIFLKIPTEQTYNLHIHLTNISEEMVTVDLHDLPWNLPRDVKWLSATRMDAPRTALKQRVHRWEIGSQEVRLQPGESIQNKILLNSRIPTLLEDIKKFGVQFEWECPPHAIKYICNPQAANRLIIEKGDRGHADVYQIDTTQCRQSDQRIGLIDISADDEVLFLHTSTTVMTDLQQVRALLIAVDAYVQQCLPRWTNSWAVSFFTEAKMAGFLQDVKKDQYFKDGLWQEANIGQYSSQVRKLYRFPWLKKKRDELYLSVFH